ncbi:hypothetical protein JG687_00002539 [Phytophthora cactorum]|uniref:Uncharacterized protein n=1 Tax=Phytophthora cactorum TaxID=29920 RepID=A0A8T1UUP0_9STRA|nr:hypothetical protein JG687_00002539 [Phytophthora cactorum]
MAPLESKFDKKQTILHTNASLTPNSVTDRVAAKMIEHLTHHFHRHICSNNGPLGQAEKDVLNIEETRHGSEDEADIETFRPMKELAKQMLRAVPYVLKQYIVLQAGLAFHDKDEEGRLAKNDKEEYFQNAINKANSIADNEVQSHKLSLDRNCG